MKKVFGRAVLTSFLLLAFGISAMGIAVARPASPPQHLWTYELTDGAAYGLGICVDGDTLITVIGFGFNAGGQIVSLDPASGEVRWQMDTPESASADPIVVDGVVYAGMGSLIGGGSAVYALEASTGNQLWRTDVENRRLPATPVDALTLSDGTLYVNRGDAILLAIDAANGEIRWEVDLQKPSRGAPFVDGDTVYVSTGFDGARLFVLDTATGEERWSIDDPENPVTGPVLANGLLYVSFVDGELASFDPTTGEEHWRSAVGEFDAEVGILPYPGLPLIADGVLYVSSNGFAGAYTAALDAESGGGLWSVPTGDFAAGAPALFDGLLLVGSDSGDLLGLDPASGGELWRVAVPNMIDLDLDQASPPLVGGGLIFVLDFKGGIVGLG